MLDYNKTYEVVTQFYLDCVKFWKKQGKDVLEAHDLAEKEVAAITTNSFSPKGEELDPKAKEDFLNS